jgi:hypothetical protein
VTLPRLMEINAYQAEHAPLHILVAGYLGVGKAKAASPRSTEAPQGNDMNAFFADVASLGVDLSPLMEP